MIPARVVVTRPHRRVALHAGEARTRQDERTFVWTKFFDARECRSRHLHSEDIVISTMSSGKTVAGVRRVVRKSFVRVMDRVGLRGLLGEKNSGLVHVVPESGNAFVD